MLSNEPRRGYEGLRNERSALFERTNWRLCMRQSGGSEIRHGQEFGLAVGEPFLGSGGLALWAVPVAAGNGRRPLPALWAKPVMGSWRQLIRGPAAVAASSAHHYEARFSSAINLSVGWKTPRRRCGGTIASIASSFSVGSPRV